MKKPDFFIVGAPKCGTTAMNEYLRQHPDIFMPSEKEFGFLATDFSYRVSRITYEEYLAFFSIAKDEKRVGESSVYNLYSKVASINIKELCPAANIIIMLRNPVDVIESIHSQLVYNGDENIKDLSTALELEEKRKKGLEIPDKVTFDEMLYYRDIVKYTEQIKRYIDVFDRNKIHIIIFDDFREDLASVYKNTLDFLDVEKNFQPNFQVINANKGVRSETLKKFLKAPPEAARIVGKVLIPEPVRHALYKRLRHINTKYQPRPPMDIKLRKRLQAELTPEVERLSELLNQDLTHWVTS